MAFRVKAEDVYKRATEGTISVASVLPAHLGRLRWVVVRELQGHGIETARPVGVGFTRDKALPAEHVTGPVGGPVRANCSASGLRALPQAATEHILMVASWSYGEAVNL